VERMKREFEMLPDSGEATNDRRREGETLRQLA